MNNTVKKCLFGGALIGAGLCSTVTAGDFVWGNGGFRGNAVAAGYVGNYIFFTASGSWDESYSFGNSYAHSVANEFGLALHAEGPYSGAFHYGHSSTNFSVTEDMTVTIEWDFRADGGDEPQYMSYAMFGSFFDHQSFGLFGSEEFDLLAGVIYSLDTNVRSNGSIDGVSFLNMYQTTINVVPLPPAAFGGLAMLAGLGAYRRVRR